MLVGWLGVFHNVSAWTVVFGILSWLNCFNWKSNAWQSPMSNLLKPTHTWIRNSNTQNAFLMPGNVLLKLPSHKQPLCNLSKVETVGTWPLSVLHGAFLFRQFFLSLKDIIPCLSGMSSWWTSTMCGLHSWELGVALSASLASSETTSLGWFKHLNDSGSYLIHIIFVLFLSIFNCLNGSLWCDQVNKPTLSGVMFCKGMFGRRSGEEKVLSMSGKGPGFPQRKLTEQKHVGALGNRLAGQWWRRHLIIQTHVIKRSVHLLQIPD